MIELVTFSSMLLAVYVDLTPAAGKSELFLMVFYFSHAIFHLRTSVPFLVCFFPWFSLHLLSPFKCLHASTVEWQNYLLFYACFSLQNVASDIAFSLAEFMLHACVFRFSKGFDIRALPHTHRVSLAFFFFSSSPLSFLLHFALYH